ncbi:MAG: type II toxin-antitoxin system Phd/YefM family antitoxin [Thiohalorhabdus sp.]|uniref:type II toxin-antitoxin system Phd/YefM family antitoxin n=1 Tax=Thiohalorhabdus sp. TaxID=3094134 RepID=UPI00398093E4
MQVNIHEAKTKLSKLGELVLKGERVVIARAGKPYLDLVPHRERTEPRAPGRFKGRIHMAEDFDATPEEVIRDFEDG